MRDDLCFVDFHMRRITTLETMREAHLAPWRIENVYLIPIDLSADLP